MTMSNRDWHRQMEARRRGAARERWLLIAMVSLLVAAGGYFIASTIHEAFTGFAEQLETAGGR